jgi:lysophospholipase L1-like esterase
MLIGGAVLLAAVLFIGINVVVAARRAATFPKYWHDKANEPVATNAIRLVALGDSATEAIGATHPMDGFVGRIAVYVQSKTRRPVHITNLSRGGATTKDILYDQLPRADLKTADIVIVATASDMEGRVPLDEYRTNVNLLMQALPPDKTVVSDLPLEPGRAAYQQILQEVADAHQILRADFAKVFQGEGRRLDIFSWLVPHLNSTGYAYWFKAFQPSVDTIIVHLAK